jgi:hypothetical protein
VPLIALSENKDIVQALLMANYKTVPDAWQRRADKNPTVKYIDQRTIIGNGTNRMELIPYRTEAGERMMMVYFPEHKLLYASDLLQPDNWQKHYSLEVIEAIQRENLVVDTIYAMHMRPITYATLLKQMENYLSN